MKRPLDSEGPFAKLFDLIGCMHLLSPPAWKVISYIAQYALSRQANRPGADVVLRRDLYPVVPEYIEALEAEEQDGLPPLYEEVDDRRGRLSFVSLSLRQLQKGWQQTKKSGRLGDRGTGLAKSTIVKAIDEAQRLGILIQRHHKTREGRTMPTTYAIVWNQVAHLAADARAPRKSRSIASAPKAAHL